MVKELKDLDDDVREAVSRVAAEFKFAKDFAKELEDIAGEKDPKRAYKEAKNAIRTLRWVGKAEARVDQSEKEILKDLSDLGVILPQKLKTKDEDLAKRLTMAEGELIEMASMFTGDVKHDLDNIMKDEASLQAYEKDPAKAATIHADLTKQIGDVRKHIANLLTWIKSTQAILKEIEGFEEVLKKLAGEA